jgi:hypothetical protein
MTTTFTVRGFKVRTQSHFRFQIVAVRTEPMTFIDWRGEHKTIQPAAKIVGRTDSISKARERAAKMRTSGVSHVIIDRETGEEV